MARSVSRFTLTGPDGPVKLKPGVNYDTEAVLSRALTEASTLDGEPGTWEIREWEDLLYRVHRLNDKSTSLDVRVEVIR